VQRMKRIVRESIQKYVSPQRLVALGAIALAFLGGLMFREQEQPIAVADVEGEVEVDTPLPVRVLEIEEASAYEVAENYSGAVEAPRSSDVSFQHSGVIASLFVAEGERVAGGTPIAQLETQELELQRTELFAQIDRSRARLDELQAGSRVQEIETGRAKVRRYEAQLELTKLSAKRRKDLYLRGAIAEEEFDAAQANVEIAQAELDAARSELNLLLAGTPPQQQDAQLAEIRQLEAQVAALDLSIAQRTLYAPFSGTVTTQYLHEGSVVSAGTAVMHLVQDEALEVRIGVPLSIASTLRIGSRPQIWLEDKPYRAVLKSVLPEVDTQTQTQTLLLELPPEIPAVPGAVVRLTLRQAEATPGYWLPMAALVAGDRGLWTCYGLRDVDEAASIYEIEPHTLEVIHTESDRAFVRGTLQPGDAVVADGVHRLVPGQQVTVIDRQQSP